MVAGIGQVLLVVVVMSIVVMDVQPAACAVPPILQPIVSAGKLVTTTTDKVAKTSFATANMVLAAPKNILTKVGRTVSRKKS